MKTLSILFACILLACSSAFAQYAFRNHTKIEKGVDYPKGKSWVTNDGNYSLGLQDDGNLVVHHQNPLKVIWASGTNGKAIEKMIFQNDGNLVLYDYTKKPVWASGTQGKGHYLYLQNDGNLVVYDYDYKAIWGSGAAEKPALEGTVMHAGTVFPKAKITASANQVYALTLQEDGNLVLYKYINTSNSKAIWASGTSGRSVKECVFQGDGNLVLYDYAAKAIWATNTNGKGRYLALQNDGNLVLYDVSRNVIWQSNTSGR